MKLLYEGSTLLALTLASGCGNCVVGVYGNLYCSVKGPKIGEHPYVREHHVKWYTQLLGDMCGCETGRVRDDGIRNKGGLVSHFIDR